VALLGALWLVVGLAGYGRQRLRPAFHALTVGLVLSLAVAAGVAACSSDSTTPVPGATDCAP